LLASFFGSQQEKVVATRLNTVINVNHTPTILGSSMIYSFLFVLSSLVGNGVAVDHDQRVKGKGLLPLFTVITT
jgi:hypothetical protein